MISSQLVVDPTFPPLLRGEKVEGTINPFQKAVAASVMGTDPGVIFFAEREDALHLAMVLAPETALSECVGVCHAAMLAVADSLGALGPPELAIHFGWPFDFKVNGAKCGALSCQASTADPADIPDWLVIGIEIPFMRPADLEPGENPESTWLYEEGCVELTVPQVIESWSRHALIWLRAFEDGGYESIQDHWRAKCDSIGREIESPATGTFVGINETGGLLLRRDGLTDIYALTGQLINS
jgi:biotin-(acetyl-CoA carboxylase) ligase